MIFIEFYNDIHSKFINIGLPTYTLVEDRVPTKQRYWLEWPNDNLDRVIKNELCLV